MANMRRWLPQFSLRGFLIAIAVIGVGLAGVLSATEGWAFALGAAFHLLLPVGVIFAIGRTGAARAFWIGVVVVNVWCNLFFQSKITYLAQDRLLDDFHSFLDERVSNHIATLHEQRTAREVEHRVSEMIAGITGQTQSGVIQSEVARQRSQYAFYITKRVTTTATTCARRFLMILLSLGGGCLSAWAYRCREPASGP